jgi:hypothetical protein
VLGYTDTQPAYVYSPTLSIQEFQQAWGGQLWSQGFSMTLMYNEGNDARRWIAETLARNIEAITDTFHVNVISDTWPVYLDARESRRLPIYIGGWIEDVHHPHDWVYPFLHSGGGYMRFQSFPTAMSTQFDVKIGECFQLTDVSAAQACYEELQHMSYVSATAMWGVQPVGRHYERMEVLDYFFNPSYLFPYYYALSKNTPPTLSGLPDQLFDHSTSLPSTIDLWAYASDAESPASELAYVIEGLPPAGAGVSLSGNRYVTVNPSASWCGGTDVAIRVTDPDGLWNTATFRVAVSWSCQGPVSPLGAPALVAPTDGSVAIDHTPTFAWGAVVDADTYHIQIDDGADYASPQVDEIVPGLDYTSAPGLGAGVYYWRVRAFNDDGAGAWSEGWAFTMLAPKSRLYLPFVVRNHP